MPDMGFLNLSDMTGVARRIAAAVEIPVMIDADTGYGNAMNVVTASRPLSAVCTFKYRPIITQPCKGRARQVGIAEAQMDDGAHLYF